MVLAGHRAFGGLCFCAIVSQALGPAVECNALAAGAVRVLVGAFEGPFYPTVAFLTRYGGPPPRHARYGCYMCVLWLQPSACVSCRAVDLPVGEVG